jgi:hypothetical protein
MKRVQEFLCRQIERKPRGLLLLGAYLISLVLMAASATLILYTAAWIVGVPMQHPN